MSALKMRMEGVTRPATDGRTNGVDAPSTARANGVQSGSWLGKTSRKLWYLAFEGLCNEARRRTGLDDFGAPDLTPALPILLNSLENEAGLHAIGRFLMRIHLRDLLETRLKLAETWKRRAVSAPSLSLKSPVFIVGMPRSGSTFLHELLAADSANRAPRVWEVMFPLTKSHLGGSAVARSIRKAEMRLWWFRRLVPQADSVYPMRALTPHECVAVQSYSFYSEEFISTCRIPSYEAFLRSTDLSPAYLWQKRFLQHLQSDAPEQRWILKSPDHVYGLKELFTVFPDALLVQTHRNPMEVLASSTDLTRALRGLYGRPASREDTLAAEAQTLADNTERFMRFRDQHPELADRIVDVKYSELVANPLAAVHRIYAQLGVALDKTAGERMEQLASNRSRYHGPRASAAQDRLKLQSVFDLGRFSQYCRRFGLPCQEAEGKR
jgi:hypothetical protein